MEVQTDKIPDPEPVIIKVPEKVIEKVIEKVYVPAEPEKVIPKPVPVPEVVVPKPIVAARVEIAEKPVIQDV